MAEDPLVARFAAHPAREQLRTQLTRIQKQIDERLAALDANSASRLRRLHRVLAYVDAVVESADPIVAGTTGLDQLKQFLDLIEPQLAGFESGNASTLKAALAQADAIIPQLHRFPPTPDVDDAVAYEAITAKLQSEQTKILSEAQKSASATVQTISVALQAANSKIEQHVSNAEMLGKTVEQLQQQIGQQSGRLDTALSKFTTDTASLEQQREKRFQDWMAKQAEGIETRSTEQIGKITTLLQKTEQSASAAIDSLEQTKRKAAEILNVVGNIGATGNYKLTADANEMTANKLRNGAVGLFLVMVVTVVAITINLVHDGINWQVAGFRLFSALILALPAAYLARESARHREVAERMRRMELELASIDAFNALLPEDQRNAIKGEMARRYFGNVSADNSAKVDPDQQMTLKEFFKELSSLVKAFRK